MQRPLKTEYNPYYQHYIDLAPEEDFKTTFQLNFEETIEFFESISAEKHDYRYAEGKWSVKEVLMHIIDTERVMAYRAFVATRLDNVTPLPSFDEDSYANNVKVDNRTLAELVEEFKTVRKSTQTIYSHITEEQSMFEANAVTHPITARALGFIMIGHIRHHINVIKERYL
ncbi:DinB family protein [Solitalea sp. MAHUQ-68]|uniref:DinB family protein n=1 Tax=Solitalea agri TaxID=2953739 RepID=A0A9X2JC51_9SPHI|nr:DinB family protein [Solitalea agri]MCO4291400.1 DinB family protein [Solitalea agri]